MRVMLVSMYTVLLEAGGEVDTAKDTTNLFQKHHSRLYLHKPGTVSVRDGVMVDN